MHHYRTKIITFKQWLANKLTNDKNADANKRATLEIVSTRFFVKKEKWNRNIYDWKEYFNEKINSKKKITNKFTRNDKFNILSIMWKFRVWMNGYLPSKQYCIQRWMIVYDGTYDRYVSFVRMWLFIIDYVKIIVESIRANHD